MCNPGAWFEKEKKKWYTWIVGHLLNQKNNSKVNKITCKDPTSNAIYLQIEMYKFESCHDWQTQRAGLWTGEKCGANSNFCQTIHRYCGFYFHLLFMCDLPVFQIRARIIPTCFISSCLLYFGIATLQMELNAQGWGAGAPWRVALKDSAHYGKGVHRNSVLHFLVEHNSFSMKRRNSWKVGKLGNYLTYFSTHSGEQ